MAICAIIPALNAEKTIGNIIRQVKESGIEVVVIDDGSSDSTSNQAEENRAIVLKNTVNSGKGYSLRKGFAYALSRGYSHIFTLDADGQHSPADIPGFLSLLNSHPEAELIIGNRMGSPEGMPFIRRMTNRLMSFILSRLSGQYIPDTQNGFRLINSSILKKLKLKSSRFEIESELIVKASGTGTKILSVPITSIYHGRQSKIQPIPDTFRFLKFIISYIIFKGE